MRKDPYLPWIEIEDNSGGDVGEIPPRPPEDPSDRTEREAGDMHGGMMMPGEIMPGGQIYQP